MTGIAEAADLGPLSEEFRELLEATKSFDDIRQVVSTTAASIEISNAHISELQGTQHLGLVIYPSR